MNQYREINKQQKATKDDEPNNEDKDNSKE